MYWGKKMAFLAALQERNVAFSIHANGCRLHQNILLIEVYYIIIYCTSFATE